MVWPAIAGFFMIFSENEVYRIIGAQPFERFEQVFEELGST